MNITDEGKAGVKLRKDAKKAASKKVAGSEDSKGGKGGVVTKVGKAFLLNKQRKMHGRNITISIGTGIHRKLASPKAYKIGVKKSGHMVSAASLLGVMAEEKESLNWMEWVSVIRHGIPSTAVDTLVEFLSITKSELSEAVDIPFRTLVRRKGEALLDSDESAKLVRVARVIERAEEVFEDRDAARVWLKSANASLSGQTPISLLDTEIGAESVMDALGRIEHGVFY